MRSALSLDGKAYFNLHVVSCKRSFSVLDGDNAGRVMTGAMTRDIIGTYYNTALKLTLYRQTRRNTMIFMRAFLPRSTATC